MSSIAIIPARGGSKRIPRKNIKDFLGKPIIAYSIETAIASGLFEEVMVSTDDEEIAEIAQSYGAKVPFMRRASTADDNTTTVAVLREVLDMYSVEGRTFTYGCCIYPTAPFASVALLEAAFTRLVSEDFDTVFPVLPFSFPIQRAVKLDQSGKVKMFQPEHMTSRSQDLEPGYHDSGQFYWFKVDALLTYNKLWTDNTGSIVLSEMQAHDIDTAEDWKVAELKYKMLSPEAT